MRSSLPDQPEHWLDKHGDMLYRYAMARVNRRDVAEDLVQETLLAALKTHSHFRGQSGVRTWLVGILIHKIQDYHRRLPKVNQVRIDGTTPSSSETIDPSRPASSSSPFDARGFWLEAVSNWPSPETWAERNEFQEVLRRCLAKLPEHLAVAFAMRELDHCDIAEICQISQISASNLRVRLFRARVLLRDCLQQNWFGDEPGER